MFGDVSSPLHLQPEEPKDEEKVSEQLKKLRKSKNPNFSVLEKGKEEEKKTGRNIYNHFIHLAPSLFHNKDRRYVI